MVPIIFAAWSDRVCRGLDASLGVQWSQQHVTLFSDDTFSFWRIGCFRDLVRAAGQLDLNKTLERRSRANIESIMQDEGRSPSLKFLEL